VDADLVALPTIRIGDLEITGATAVVLDLVEMMGRLMEGILGMDLFDGVLLTLDPSGARAMVTRGALVLGEPGVIKTEVMGPGQVARDRRACSGRGGSCGVRGRTALERTSGGAHRAPMVRARFPCRGRMRRCIYAARAIGHSHAWTWGGAGA